MSYPITQSFIPGLPKIPFRGGVGIYEGLVIHCTDNPNHIGGDTPTGERNFESSTYDNAFVHFFTGVENARVKILQVAPIEYISWGAGHTSNGRFLNLELCMYDDENLFKMSYQALVWLTAKLLRDKNLGVSDKGTVWSHLEISNQWHETTHTDPIQYFKYHGISWDQFILDVKKEYSNSGFLCTIEVQCETDVRAEASHISGYITNAHKGNIFNVIQEKNGFYQVALTDYTRGWIDKSNTMVIYS
jgi:N-acetylmuramoyl-L-alanine amidase